MPELEQIQARPIPRVFQGRVIDRAVAHWRADVFDAASNSFLDLSGNGIHARSGSASTPNTNDPLRLAFEGARSVYYPGVAGNYISAPDSAALSITGNLDLRADIAAADYTPSGTVSLVLKSGSYALQMLSDGRLRFLWVDSGSVTRSVSSSVATGFTDGARGSVRVTFQPASGTATFYTAPDFGTWVQLGVPAVFGATSIIDSAGGVELGSSSSGTIELLTGRLYRAQIYSGIAGTLVADFKANELASPFLTYNDAVGNVWTLNRPASSSSRRLSVVDRSLALFGTDDYLETVDDARLDLDAATSISVVVAGRIYNSPSVDFSGMANKAGTAAGEGWRMEVRSTSPAACYLLASDAVNAAQQQAPNITSGKASAFGYVFDRPGARLRTYLDGVAGNTAVSTPGALGDASNTNGARIGRRQAAGTNYLSFEFFAAAVFRQVLSPAELRQVAREMGISL